MYKHMETYKHMYIVYMYIQAHPWLKYTLLNDVSCDATQDTSLSSHQACGAKTITYKNIWYHIIS